MKQKLLALLLVLCMVMAFIPAMAVASAAEETTGNSDPVDTWEADTFTEPTQGTGTPDDPIRLTSAAEFMWFRNKLTDADGLKKSYKLTVNVHFKTQSEVGDFYTFRDKYRPGLPASCGTDATPFSGTFDGDNHIISNFYPNGTATQSMFGIVSGGTIKNLILRDSTVEGNVSNPAGAICYKLASKALVENCHVENTNVSGGAIGGIVQELSDSTVKNCSFDGTLSISSGSTNCAAGGIVASILSGKVQNCTVSGTMLSNQQTKLLGSGTLGGIVGSASTEGTTVTIENCRNTAAISGGDATSGKTAMIGGIIGYVGQTNKVAAATIRNCRNEGELTQVTGGYTGGIVGNVHRVSAFTFENNENTGDIAAVANVGGMIGYLQAGTSGMPDIILTNCLNRATISASGDNIGGFVGNVTSWQRVIQLTGCANYGAVTGANHVGGVIGYSKSNEWSNQNVVLINSTVFGNVTAIGSHAGLLVGSYWGSTSANEVSATNCVLTGTVTAAENAGGILGYTGYTNSDRNKGANVKLIGSYVDVIVKVPTGAAYAAMIAGDAQSGFTGVNLTTTDSGISIKVYVGETAVDAPAAYYTYPADGALTANTAELPALIAGALTDGTALKALNAYATANSLGAWSQGTEAPELTAFYVAPAGPAIPIDGASLTISGNVTLNLYVKKDTLTAAGVTFEKIYVVSDKGSYEGVLNGENYTFTIKDLTAKEFGENKEYAVQYTTADAPDTRVTSTATVEYSPLQYAINMYGTLPEMTTLDPLLLSIVAYADAATGTTVAQTAFTAKHENADFATLPAYAKILAEDAAKDTYTYNAKTMPGFAAKLTETVTLKLALDGTTYTDVSATIAGANLDVVKNDATGEVTISGLYATDLYNTITFTFTNGEGAETTATYSLMQYLNSYASNETCGALAQATAVYLNAARNFCLANRT